MLMHVTYVRSGPLFHPSFLPSFFNIQRWWIIMCLDQLTLQTVIYYIVKYKITDVLSLWHQRCDINSSASTCTKVDIHGSLKTRSVTRCPGDVGISCLARHISFECPQTCIYIKAEHWIWIDTIYGKCYSHNTPGQGHNDTSAVPLLEVLVLTYKS